MNDATNADVQADRRPSDQNPAGVDTTREGQGASPKSPQEQDETVGMTGGQQDAKVQQAARDEKGGLKDTSRGEASDAAYQQQKK